MQESLRNIVTHLASTIGERNFKSYDALCEAAEFLERAFDEAGHEVKWPTYDIAGKSGSSANRTSFDDQPSNSTSTTPGAADNSKSGMRMTPSWPRRACRIRSLGRESAYDPVEAG